MLRVVSLGALLACAAAGGSTTFSSADFKSYWEGKRISKLLDNVQAEWNKDFSLPNPLKSARVMVTYDLKESKGMIKQATVAGVIADQLKYQVTHTAKSGVTTVALVTRQTGVRFRANADSTQPLTQLSLSELSAAKTLEFASGRAAVNVEPSFSLPTRLAKLKLASSVALGGGSSVLAQLSATQKREVTTGYSLEYATKLSEGRTLSVSTSPADKEMELTFADATLEKAATWVASAGYGLANSYGAPRVRVRRVSKW